MRLLLKYLLYFRVQLGCDKEILLIGGVFKNRNYSFLNMV